MSNEERLEVISIVQAQFRDDMEARIKSGRGMVLKDRGEELRKALATYGESMDRNPSSLDLWRSEWAKYLHVTDPSLTLVMISDVYDKTIQARVHEELSREIERHLNRIPEQRTAPSQNNPRGLPRIPHVGELYGKLFAILLQNVEQMQGEHSRLNRMCQAIKIGLGEGVPDGETLWRKIDEAGGLVHYVDRNKRSRLKHRLAEAPQALKDAIRSCHVEDVPDAMPGDVVLSLGIAGEARQISVAIPSIGFKILEETLLTALFTGNSAGSLKWRPFKTYIFAAP
jgi:hypothetical protein